MLKILLGSRAPLQAQYDWLNGDDRDTVIRDAFAAAVEELGGKFDGDPQTWRGEAVLTTYRPVGLLSVQPHPFLNRGTYNQLAVVDVVGRHTDVPATAPVVGGQGAQRPAPVATAGADSAACVRQPITGGHRAWWRSGRDSAAPAGDRSDRHGRAQESWSSHARLTHHPRLRHPEASTPAAAALLPMIQGRLLLLAQQQFAPDQGEAAAHPALPDPADRTAGVSASPS
ncbi:MAG: hypothetical protein ACR2K2_11345, partial [Mycobacteriales bacterium]